MSRKMKVTVTSAVVFAVAAIIIVVLGFSGSSRSNDTARFGVPSAKAAEPIGHIGSGKCAEAIEKAGNADRYAFVIFHREINDDLTKARDVVQGARKRISRKSEVIEVDVNDQTEQDLANKYGANRAMLPLVLVLAPNGAIMGGLPARLIDENKLVDFVGSRASEQTLKALQQKNLVTLCVQGRKTADNKAAMRGVEELLKDPKYAQNTAVVTVDPSDPNEAKFLSQLKIDANSPVATTALLAPPGTVVATFSGAVQKDQLVNAVQAAAAPKSGGCCPPGSGKTCGPTGAAPQKSPTATQPKTVQPKGVQTTSANTPSTSSIAPTTKANAPATKQGK